MKRCTALNPELSNHSPSNTTPSLHTLSLKPTPKGPKGPIVRYSGFRIVVIVGYYFGEYMISRYLDLYPEGSQSFFAMVLVPKTAQKSYSIEYLDP